WPAPREVGAVVVEMRAGAPDGRVDDRPGPFLPPAGFDQPRARPTVPTLLAHAAGSGSPVALGTSGSMAHSLQLPSYSDTSCLPSRSMAKSSTAAVTPPPHVVATGRSRSIPAEAKAARMPASSLNVPSSFITLPKCR